jgi:circadian clock protein KaiC
MAGINMDLAQPVEAGLVAIHQVDPAELSPGELASLVRRDVEERNARVVVIDSLSGYINALPNEQFLVTQLHEMLNYLAEYGVLTILVAAQSGTIGPIQTTADVSYLADTLILLRFFEHDGSLKKAVSVVKHRKSAHEETIRELQIRSDGIHIGPPLRQFRGVLSGAPEFLGRAEDLIPPEDGR